MTSNTLRNFGVGMILLIIGGLTFGLAHFIWGGHAIYVMIHGGSFWGTILANLFYWFIQVVVGIVIAGIGFYKGLK